jgi:hypothetical protein
MALCQGNTAEHCCWVGGQVCRFLEVDTTPGRHWVCGLRRQLGSWEAVHSDPGYLEHVKPAWKGTNIPDCGDWPGPKQTCGTCGVSGDG